MAKPRPQSKRTWTQADDVENSRRIQRDADRRVWDKLGRLIGIRGRELAAAMGRMLDERIAAAFRANPTLLIEQLQSPADADALRGALFDCISDDVVEMFQILTGQETTDDTRDKKEASRSSGTNAAKRQR